MADIQSIANKLSCGANDTPNTGKLGCLSLFGTPDHLLAVKKGFKIPANTVFDLAYLTPLIQAGTVVPLIDASVFEDVSAEDTYSTNASGVKRLNLKGLPEYKFTYEESNEFYREMDKMTSFKAMDFIIGDNEGNWLVSTNSDGTYGGFTAGHSTAELKKMKVEGGDSESRSLMIQFLDRLQFDRNYSILHQDQLTFSPSEVPPVNGVHIEFVSIPTTAETAIDITLHLNSDHSTIVEGATTASDYVVTVGGATATLGLITESPAGQYSIPITSPASLGLNDVIVVTLSDGANANVVDLGGVLFRATPDGTTTVVAA